MATDPNDLAPEVDEDILELTDPIDPPEGGDGAEDEMVLELEGEQEPEQDTPVIRGFREREKENKRRIAELEKLAAPKPVALPPKPTLESCDYDEDKFETALTGWHETKRQIDTQATTQQQANEAEQRKTNEAIVAYQARAINLKVPNFQQAEQSFHTTMPEAMRIAAVRYMPEPEKLIYMLGSRPAKLQEIADMTDPVEQLLAIERFRSDIKVRPKTKPAPAPDRPQNGSGPLSVTVDKEADRLLAAAQKPGGTMDAYSRYMKNRKK